jgi:hypothetical protein
MAKAKLKEPSAATLAAVRQLAKNVSIASVKSWLKSHDLASSANTRTQLEKRVALLIDGGELTLDAFRQAAIGIEESGGKIIYLFELESPADDKKVQTSVSALQTKSSSRNFAAVTAKPTLVYALLTPTELRIKWSEDHEKPEVDLDDMSVKWVPVKKVIVFRLNLETSRAEIHYDAPEARHPHGSGKGKIAPSLYFSHYRELIEKLLGIKLVPSEVRGVLKLLIEETPPIAEVKIEEHTNQQGNRVRVTARTQGVRTDDDWKAMHSKNGDGWAYDSHSFHWKPSDSKSGLKRPLFSALDADESFLRVKADCNEEELDYAVKQIRSRQAKVPSASKTN